MILAIDPGPKESAYVMWDEVTATVSSHGKLDNYEIAELLLEKRGGFGPLYLEMIASYGMPVGAEVFETCVWIGRFMELWGHVHCTRVPRQKIKVHLCHSVRAKDSNVRQALIDRLGPQGTKKNPGPTYGIAGDMWAALALAIYAHDGLKAELERLKTCR